MTLGDLYYAGIDIQANKIHYCYYDYNKDQTVELTRIQAHDMEVKYIYVKDNELYIEVEQEENG